MKQKSYFNILNILTFSFVENMQLSVIGFYFDYMSDSIELSSLSGFQDCTASFCQIAQFGEAVELYIIPDQDLGIGYTFENGFTCARCLYFILQNGLWTGFSESMRKENMIRIISFSHNLPQCIINIWCLYAQYIFFYIQIAFRLIPFFILEKYDTQTLGIDILKKKDRNRANLYIIDSLPIEFHGSIGEVFIKKKSYLKKHV